MTREEALAAAEGHSRVNGYRFYVVREEDGSYAPRLAIWHDGARFPGEIVAEVRAQKATAPQP